MKEQRGVVKGVEKMVDADADSDNDIASTGSDDDGNNSEDDERDFAELKHILYGDYLTPDEDEQVEALRKRKRRRKSKGSKGEEERAAKIFKCPSPKCPSSFQASGSFTKGTKAPLKSEGECELIPQQNVVSKGPNFPDNTKKSGFKCPHCSISVKTKNILQRHIRVVHEGVRAFKCPQCVKSFTRRYRLRDHVAIVHEGRVLHKCPRPNCSRTFACKQNVIIHVATVHEKRRDFKCPICHKGFFTKAYCATHVSVVHGKKAKK